MKKLKKSTFGVLKPTKEEIANTKRYNKEMCSYRIKVKLKVVLIIAIILTGLLSAYFLFMYFAYSFHSMYLFNCLLCNQGLIMLVVMRGIK